MEAQRAPERITCVNCYICVNRLCPMRYYTVLELDIRMASIICSWVDPLIITEEDYVCGACRDLALSMVNKEYSERLQGSPGSFRGHKCVCILCGRSTLKNIRSHKVLRDNPTRKYQSLIDLIQHSIEPRELTSSDSVCYSCWIRNERKLRRPNTIEKLGMQLVNDILRENTDTPGLASPELVQEIQPEQIAEVQNLVRNPPPASRDSETIILPDFKRAANTSRRCLFIKCRNSTRRKISDKLRATILSKHNFYIPKSARVCAEHLKNNSWDSLKEMKNSTNKFNSEQIQHIFSFINVAPQTLDFENIGNIEDNILQYWSGMTKSNFNSILEDTPQIRSIKRGNLGLAALLIKTCMGDSNERLAALLKTPKSTLVNIMNKVKAVLNEHETT